MRKLSRNWSGLSPVSVLDSTWLTQRGLVIAVISASTAARSRRVLPRARVACRSVSLRRALARVCSNPRDWAAVEAEITAITKPRWVSQVLSSTLTGDSPDQLRLSFRIDTRARNKLERGLFGKRILFTNRDAWPTADVVAPTIAHLMRQQAERAGLDLSVRELLATLAGIGETVLLYHDGGKGRPRTQRILTDTDPTQQRLAELFGIDRYAPTR